MMSLKQRVAAGPQTADLSEVGRYDSPAEIPMIRVSILPGTYAYEDLQPLITADGAPIAATGQGTWGQLYAAGRMY